MDKVVGPSGISHARTGAPEQAEWAIVTLFECGIGKSTPRIAMRVNFKRFNIVILDSRRIRMRVRGFTRAFYDEGLPQVSVHNNSLVIND
eukprot:CAMPEP_0172636322 /NCGR_PEP_ID=MMETSP1068-20121228/203414_1 /TAXON_ID=35684 /ORGANISM="Pseudopedinella elastica, Strain CCMP716" /LENGTH=89 /DNA_ID=CAMNT_0013448709 /DNA_START=135 /DNA_END=401 /DNA_ORIENTATION=-